MTNVAAQCAWTGTRPPPLTGNPDVDMFNAAVADGTANGGVPGVMVTEDGGPFRVTALGEWSANVADCHGPEDSVRIHPNRGNRIVQFDDLPQRDMGHPVRDYAGMWVIQLRILVYTQKTKIMNNPNPFRKMAVRPRAGRFLALLMLSDMPAVLIPALLMLVLAGGATASAQVVTNSADSGPGTLRSAIVNAANGAIIIFAPSLSGATISLSSTLTINTNLTIDASALPGGLQINGNGAVQIFYVASTITVFLNSLTITNGYTATNSAIYYVGGGGIDNYGTLTLTNCTLSGNSANSDGGGIYNYL